MSPSGRVTRTLLDAGGDQRAPTELVTLMLGSLRAEVLTHGAHLVGLCAPDREGVADDVVVSLRQKDGAVDLAAYRDPVRNPHLGGMAGRYANRIAGARFTLDGTEHRLVPNEGPNQLHGGPGGFDQMPWRVVEVAEGDRAGVLLGLTSPGGDQGYPGTVEVTVRYELRPGGVVMIETVATTDAPTVLSVTNHTYWNLAGAAVGTSGAAAAAASHRLRVAADRVVVVDESLLPTGELRPVDHTAFDLRHGVALGELHDHPGFGAVGGMDHCLVFAADAAALDHQIELVHPDSGRRLRIRTDQPGVQVYTANFGAGPWPRHGAVCLETQQLPDAPNQPTFPSPVLRPGQTYRHCHELTLDAV